MVVIIKWFMVGIQGEILGVLRVLFSIINVCYIIAPLQFNLDSGF